MAEFQHRQAEAHLDLPSSDGDESGQWGLVCPGEDGACAELWGSMLHELQHGLDLGPQTAARRRDNKNSEHVLLYTTSPKFMVTLW